MSMPGVNSSGELQEIQALDIPVVVTYHPSEVYTWNKDAYTNVIAGVGTGLYNFWNFVRRRAHRRRQDLPDGDRGILPVDQPYRRLTTTTATSRSTT